MAIEFSYIVCEIYGLDGPLSGGLEKGGTQMARHLEYSEDDIATIRSLLAKYFKARGYYSETRGYHVELLAAQVGRNKAHLSRLLDPKAKWPGLAEDLARNLDTVLMFGDDVDDDKRHHWEKDYDPLVEEDYDLWAEATHIKESDEKREERRIEHEGKSHLRKFLDIAATPSYMQKWGRSRWEELRFNYKDAEPLLKKAITEAQNHDAPPLLLGIMYHDWADAYLTQGKLKQAKDISEQGEAQYHPLLKDPRTANIPSVRLGIARAKIQQLQIAVSQGNSEEECNKLFKEAELWLEDLKKRHGLSDYYGWSKTYLVLGYLHIVEGNFDRALEMAQKAYDSAQQHETFSKLPDRYWLIRDGSFLGYTWIVLHAMVLKKLIYDLRLSITGNSFPKPKEEHPLGMLRAISLTWWGRRFPPIFPFYEWRSEVRTKSVPRVKSNLVEMVNKQKHLNYVEYLPLLMMSCGDFSIDCEESVDEALAWYEKAKELASKHELWGQARLAERRIAQYKGH